MNKIKCTECFFRNPVFFRAKIVNNELRGKEKVYIFMTNRKMTGSKKLFCD